MEPHRRRDVQRPGLRRQPERHRLEAHRLPRRAVRLLGRGDALRSRPLRQAHHDVRGHSAARPREAGTFLSSARSQALGPRGGDAPDADPAGRARRTARRGRVAENKTKGKGNLEMANKHADVVIIGVGAAGAILARELTEAGFTVLGIDKGPYYHSDDFWTKFDELRYSTRAGLSPTMDTDPMTCRHRRRPRAPTTADSWAADPRPRAVPGR